MICKSSGSIAILLLLVVASAPLAAQDSATRCRVRVTEPHAGQGVSLKLDITGTATLPVDHHLWIFVRPAKFQSFGWWYPQSEARANDAGEWRAPDVTFGRPQMDIGTQFEVTAAVFAPQQHARLVNYLRDAMNKDKYDPIEMPAAVCVAPIVIVTKMKD